MSLGTNQQQSFQGCLSAYCDDLLRKEAVWSEEHLYQLFVSWIEASKREILPVHVQDPHVRDFCKAYFSSRLAKAKRNSVPLLIQDVHSYQINKKVCDIRYGWDISGSYAQRVAKSQLPPIDTAFTVEHANQYIPLSGPFRDLSELLEAQSTSFLERTFYSEWRTRYYAPAAPALIPEVHRFSTSRDGCGKRSFTYLDAAGYPHRGRIDFFVYNAKAGAAAFIELDGQSSHKTAEQRQVDAMKRNVCAEARVPLLVFTYRDIKNALDSVMSRLDYLFRAI